MTITNTDMQLRPSTWTIDPDHTTVAFSVRHLGLAKVRGRFENVHGRVVIGPDLASTTVSVNIAMSSVNTGNVDRDTHLRSTAFFNVELNPTMTFQSTCIRPNGERFALTGDLTINGITNTIDVDAEFFGTSINDMDHSERAGFAAIGTLSRKTFGIDFNVPVGGDKVLIGDTIHIDIDAELVFDGTGT